MCTWPTDFPNTSYAICRPCANIELDERMAAHDFAFVVVGAIFIVAVAATVGLLFAFGGRQPGLTS
jgi:hypothetical protein